MLFIRYGLHTPSKHASFLLTPCSDISYEAGTCQLSYKTTHLAPLALLTPRSRLLPYKAWNCRPTGECGRKEDHDEDEVANAFTRNPQSARLDKHADGICCWGLRIMEAGSALGSEGACLCVHWCSHVSCPT